MGALLVAAACLLALPNAVRAQDEADSTWDDYGLNPDGYKLDEDVFGHVSTGWFPQPYFGQTLSYGGPLFFTDVYDRARNIRSAAFKPTAEAFSDDNPLSGKERKILKPNSDEEEDDGHPTTSYTEYELQYLLNLPLPAVIRLTGGLQVTEGLLFSNDTSRRYLTLGGAEQSFNEVSTMYLKEYSLLGGAGIVIPVYGGFIKNESVRFASYYYLFGGMSATYAVNSKATQYTQIANAKDAIRYSNGGDTTTLMDKQVLSGLNRFRTHIDVGVGWNLAFESFALGFELFASLPQTAVIKDADWKQYFVGIRVSAGWHWVPEK